MVALVVGTLIIAAVAILGVVLHCVCCAAMCTMLFLIGSESLGSDADEDSSDGSLLPREAIKWLQLGATELTEDEEKALEREAGYNSLEDGDSASAVGARMLAASEEPEARARRLRKKKIKCSGLLCRTSAYGCCILLGPVEIALGAMCLTDFGGHGSFCGAGGAPGGGITLIVFGVIFALCLGCCVCAHGICCWSSRSFGGGGAAAEREREQDAAASAKKPRRACRACGFLNKVDIDTCVMCGKSAPHYRDGDAVEGPYPGPSPVALVRQQSWTRSLNENADGALCLRFERVDEGDVPSAAGPPATTGGAAAASAAADAAISGSRVRGGLVRAFTPDGLALEWHHACDGYAVPIGDGTRGAAQAEIEAMLRIAPMKFGVKRKWFDAQMSDLASSTSRGILTPTAPQITITRDVLLIDSMNKVMAMTGPMFGQKFRIKFEGEAGIDQGGLTTDWIDGVIEHLFHPDAALFEQSQLDSITYQVRPRPLESDELRSFAPSGGGAQLLPTPPQPQPTPPPLLAAQGSLSADELGAIEQFGAFAGLDVVDPASEGFRTASFFCERSGFVAERALHLYFDAQASGAASVPPASYRPSTSALRARSAANAGGRTPLRKKAASLATPRTRRRRAARMTSGPLEGRLRSECYRFAGRMIAKALRMGQPTAARLTRPMLKHIIGVPISVSDLQFVDTDAYTRMMSCFTMDEEELEELYLDMTAIHVDEEGTSHVVELKPGGADEAVVAENLDEYIMCVMRWTLIDRITDDLAPFLAGVYDVIDPHFFVAFDW